MSDPLRIIFMGTPDFAVPSLQALLDCPDKVIAVVCQPDRRQGRGKKLCPPPVKVLAEEAEVPVLQPTCLCDDAFMGTISDLQPDLIVVTAYGRILSGRLLNLPRLGTINVHGSLLPKYRGAAPIQWAIINGQTETGVTIMQMDEGVDTGDILLSLPMPITEDDTGGTLFNKLADLGGQALFEALSRIKRDALSPISQDDSLSCSAPMLTKEMGRLDWTKSAQELHCLIRGLDPWPSAYGFIDNRRFRFFKPQVIPGQVKEQPGTLCRADKNGVLIATGENYLLVREIQPEGKKRMCVQACICGMKLPLGKQFS